MKPMQRHAPSLFLMGYERCSNMCDTFVAPPGYTAERLMLFGKNSDRQRNEAQITERCPGALHEEGSRLTCTYISVPQVRKTHTVLLCRPFWSWGAEMGANEHGVVIGNEALFARVPAPEKPALTGLDLVRLALERAETAAAATEVIGALLQEHGQGGNCGHIIPAFYHNAFVVADRNEAFVMDTIGSDWVCERIGKARAVSNIYSVGSEAVRASPGIPGLLDKLGHSGAKPAQLAAVFADPNTSHIGSARIRQARAGALLERDTGHLDLEDFMHLARDHGPEPYWDPTRALPFSVCIHARAEDRIAQTTGAMISELRAETSVHWVTATAAPCVSIFKPLFLDVPLPEHGSAPSDRFAANSLWWTHERLHRAALAGDFPGFIEEIREERDAAERVFRERVAAVRSSGNPEERFRVVAQCWEEASLLEERWSSRARERKTVQRGSPYEEIWQLMNSLAGLPDRLAPPAK